MWKLLSEKHRTFRPIKQHAGENGKKLSDYARTTVGNGNAHAAVQLPKGENQNEWLAVHVVDFFNEISTCYALLSEYCTKTTCPIMSAGERFEYHWADGVDIKQPIKVSAPEYVDYLMSWVDKQLNDESIFPIAKGKPFPKNFKDAVSLIFRRLFRVYAHIYHAHIEKVVALGVKAHLNTSLKHFAYFVREFQLIERSELEPLQEVIDTLIAQDEKKDKETAASTDKKN